MFRRSGCRGGEGHGEDLSGRMVVGSESQRFLLEALDSPSFGR